MLEEDSDLYTGITDVSHEYPKMFIVRPQFFVAVIGLLRNAAQGTIVVRAELEQVKKQNIDITNFEADLDDFKSAFGRNYDLAKRKFDTAIDEIDKAIERLQKVKEGLLGSENNLRLAEALQQRGVTAWLDKAEMRIGESLRRRVDRVSPRAASPSSCSVLPTSRRAGHSTSLTASSRSASRASRTCCLSGTTSATQR